MTDGLTQATIAAAEQFGQHLLGLTETGLNLVAGGITNSLSRSGASSQTKAIGSSSLGGLSAEARNLAKTIGQGLSGILCGPSLQSGNSLPSLTQAPQAVASVAGPQAAGVVDCDMRDIGCMVPNGGGMKVSSFGLAGAGM